MELLKITVCCKVSHTSNGVDAGRDGVHNFICGRDGWVSYALVLKFNCVAEPLTVCVVDVAAISAIVLRRGG